jgi:CRP-like cAMP-binding protein
MSAMRRKRASAFGNHILQALPAEPKARLASRLKPFNLVVPAVLAEAGSEVQHIYFPQNCVLSTLAVSESGHAVETATIGREGAFGLVAAINGHETYARCLVQHSGAAYRIAAADFKKEFDRSAHVRAIVMGYIEALLIQVQQSVLCNALHPVESRLSRWLLLMQDRADTDTLPLTQEFLAGMLGVNRTTVTSAARHLQSVGLISYRRGVVHIRKRAALEDASCECYRIVRSHYQRLLAAP